MAKNNYENYTKEQLIAELKKLSKRKKYGLVWEEEKTKEKFEADTEGKLPVLVEDKKREIKTDADTPTHILIEGDNYHALSVLNYTHAKSIDVMYFDPPYNTGNNDFKYNDKFVDREDSYRHSKWLSFMSKRLKLAKNLLKDTGVIFISIDDNEMAQLKLLCDEIFLEENYISNIIWQSKTGSSDAKGIDTLTEYILVYSKNRDKTKFNKNESTYDLNRYRYKDKYFNERGPYYTDNLDRGGLRYSDSLNYGISCPDKQISFPNGRNKFEKDGWTWKWGKDKVEWGIKNGFIEFKKSKNKPNGWAVCYKNYLLVDNEGNKIKRATPYKNIIDDIKTGEGTAILKEIFGQQVFQYSKPVNTILRLLSIVKMPIDAKILDFFAGTGTTGHAVLEVNKEDGGSRQFILCTNNENNICTEVCYPRVKKVIQGYKNSKGDKVDGLGGNLKYYKTNFVGSEPTHRNKKLLTDKSVEMICVRENTFEEVVNKKDIFIFKSKEKFTAILFDEMKMEEFKNEIKKLKMPVSVYVFSLEGDDFKEEFENFKNDINLCAIPEAILKVYRRIYGAGQMKLKVKK